MLNRALARGSPSTEPYRSSATSSRPRGKEFRVLFEENRLGLDMKDALKKLAGPWTARNSGLFGHRVISSAKGG